jgi:hypothetical protein
LTSTKNLELVRSMNPDLVIDYTTEDFTKRPERYDVVADVAGDRSFRDMRRLLAPNGRIVLIGAAKKSWFAVFARLGTSALRARLGSKWLVLHMATITNQDLVVEGDGRGRNAHARHRLGAPVERRLKRSTTSVPARPGRSRRHGRVMSFGGSQRRCSGSGSSGTTASPSQTKPAFRTRDALAF